ncbi:MAG: phosphoribosylanthranilate isomerase, partial [Haloarculaceae archaeon]
TRAKVCGVTSAGDRDAVVSAGADALGVIVEVDVETPREITASVAADLVAGTPPFVSTVLVTMPAAVQDAVTLQRVVGADAVQVHDGLAPEYLGGLRRRIDADVVAVVGIEDPDIEAYAAHADAILIDSRGENGGGGTGEPTDWQRAADLVDALDVPVVLAGGLTPENVADAVVAVAPYAVDVASGVERTGGVKEPEAVRAFVSEAHRTGDPA